MNLTIARLLGKHCWYGTKPGMVQTSAVLAECLTLSSYHCRTKKHEEVPRRRGLDQIGKAQLVCTREWHAQIEFSLT